MRAAGDRVERLLSELDELGDTATRAKAEALVRTLLQLYGAGLEQIMQIVVENGAATVLHRLTADRLIAALLILHDLHPLNTDERIRAALEGVRPYLGLPDGGVELIDITADGVARLRLAGSRHGCPSAQLTAARTIERAVTDAAPEICRVEVTGLSDTTRPLLQIGSRPRSAFPAAEEAVT